MVQKSNLIFSGLVEASWKIVLYFLFQTTNHFCYCCVYDFYFWINPKTSIVVSTRCPACIHLIENASLVFQQFQLHPFTVAVLQWEPLCSTSSQTGSGPPLRHHSHHGHAKSQIVKKYMMIKIYIKISKSLTSTHLVSLMASADKSGAPVGGPCDPIRMNQPSARCQYRPPTPYNAQKTEGNVVMQFCLTSAFSIKIN